MTVIAYRSGVLAGDGRIVDNKGYIFVDNDTKVFRLTHFLFGASGPAEYCEALRKYTEAGEEPPKLKGTQGIRIGRNARIETFEGTTWYPIMSEYYAIGVGCSLALVALDIGLSASQAVQAACKRNCDCGGIVHSVTW